MHDCFFKWKQAGATLRMACYLSPRQKGGHTKCGRTQFHFPGDCQWFHHRETSMWLDLIPAAGLFGQNDSDSETIGGSMTLFHHGWDGTFTLLDLLPINHFGNGTQHSWSHCHLPNLLIKQIQILCGTVCFYLKVSLLSELQAQSQNWWNWAATLCFFYYSLFTLSPALKGLLNKGEGIYWAIFRYMAGNNAISPLGGLCCKCSELYSAVDEGRAER